jgi:FtsP/CotA-like multicopper oxidase with cupredoxin domain
MVGISLMAQRNRPIARRHFLTGSAAGAVAFALPRIAAAQGPEALTLTAEIGTLALRPSQPGTPVWALEADRPVLRFRRGTELQVTFQNNLPVPAVLDWRGLDGAAAAEPLTARAPLAPGGKEIFAIALRYAGTLLCDLRLLGYAAAQPSRSLVLIVEETEPVATDRDEVFLVEDWRLRADGTAVMPGIDAADAMSLATVNGRITPDIPLRTNQRLRFRFINGFQRQVIALKTEGHDVRVMAMDSLPAEPFFARNGALVLAPGGRVDAFIDATAPAGSISQILLHDGKEARPVARLVTSSEPAIRPTPLPLAPALPANGLPAQLDLKGALRVDLPLGDTTSDWLQPAKFSTSAAPAFRAKVGRTVVLALTNRAGSAMVFHLHGHHFRLLDRLDDGWKPFWLDTLAVEPGQTQRIAFAAEHAGRWLIEAAATDWAAPRFVRWYDVQ